MRRNTASKRKEKRKRTDFVSADNHRMKGAKHREQAIASPEFYVHQKTHQKQRWMRTFSCKQKPRELSAAATGVTKIVKESSDRQEKDTHMETDPGGGKLRPPEMVSVGKPKRCFPYFKES